jgi:uncharacterized protein (DUF1501 family)
MASALDDYARSFRFGFGPAAGQGFDPASELSDPPGEDAAIVSAVETDRMFTFGLSAFRAKHFSLGKTGPVIRAVSGLYEKGAPRPADGKIAPAKAFAANDFFAFHEKLPTLEALFKAREPGAIHAVSTPCRERRHFDAPDFPERPRAA